MISRESHGGNIYKASEHLGIHESKIIDFSASINPLGVPPSVAGEIRKSVKSLVHYPDPDVKLLRLQIAERLDVDADSVICGNGSTELIYLVVRTLKPEKVLIPAPTFSEYERAAMMQSTKHEGRRAKGEGKIVYFKLNRGDDFDIDPARFIRSMKGCAMAFICNPNNPTGRLIEKDALLEIAEAAKSSKCYLVVDEAFIDFMPERSIIRDVRGNPCLIVLRSMTKFYALSGIRLGYGVFPLNLVQAMEAQKEPWTVNTLAQRAGYAAINDVDYAEKTFRVLREEKEFMEKGFRELRINYTPSSANYYLIRLDNADEVIRLLRNKGILLRGCANFQGLDGSYIRVAVKTRKDNTRLLRELSAWLKA